MVHTLAAVAITESIQRTKRVGVSAGDKNGISGPFNGRRTFLELRLVWLKLTLVWVFLSGLLVVRTGMNNLNNDMVASWKEHMSTIDISRPFWGGWNNFWRGCRLAPRQVTGSAYFERCRDRFTPSAHWM